MPLALVLSLLAARDARLSAAIDRYESARFAAARDALIELVDAPALSEKEQIEARTYLAACYLALKDKGSARLQLRELARQHPEAMPSPAQFAPDMIALADEVWAEVEKRKPPEPREPPPVVTAPPAVEPPQPMERPRAVPPSRAAAFLPFGIGHFMRGDSAQGVVWLAVEAGLFIASGICAVALTGLKRGRNAEGEIQIYEDQFGAATALNYAYPIAFYAGLAALVANVIVALITWPSESSP